MNKKLVLKKAKHKLLLTPKKRCSGRNNAGEITVRHRGGGNKKFYRRIDFKRDKFDIPGIVEQVEYDPNRSAHIALILYKDGERRYIICPEGLNVGDEVISGKDVEIKVGNSLPMRYIPQGTSVHCIELKPGKGAQLARSAGCFMQLGSVDNKKVRLKMPSKEIRYVNEDCMATIGTVSNSQHGLKKLGKAGKSRHLGRRPHVRGVAMNPVDHPHGGGEGRTSGGRHPVSPTGIPAKGYKTRDKRKKNKDIVRRRNDN